MAATIVNVDIGWYKNGDTFCIDISGDNSIGNDGPDNILQNIIATITLPTGLSFGAGSTVSQGTYDSGTGIWQIGSILPCVDVTASICFDVDDDTEGPYTIVITTTADACDCVIKNPLLNFVVDGVSCGNVKDCLSYGEYTDDATAAIGLVPVGGVYYNTTNSKLHTRMV